MRWVFFGSSEFSVYVLDELLLHNLLPDLIVTTPDKPKGRKLVLTPTPIKTWAHNHDIEVLDPHSLNPSTSSGQATISNLRSSISDLFLVASYGKIIPPEVFEIPPRKTLNIHPSLLPKYRGASPIQSQILNGDTEVGVTIMQIEATMDTGPIVVQKKLGSEGKIMGRRELEVLLAKEGARLFAHVVPEWLQGVIDPIIQNESEATYCTKITKEDGLLDLSLDPMLNLRKIKAFEGWPSAYFFQDSKRVIVIDARISEGKLELLRVLPEGKKEMAYSDFLRGKRT